MREPDIRRVAGPTPLFQEVIELLCRSRHATFRMANDIVPRLLKYMYFQLYMRKCQRVFPLSSANFRLSFPPAN